MRTIDPADFAGSIELYFNGLSSGWTAIVDQYGSRLLPMVLEEVWDWLETNTVGTYVLQGIEGDGRGNTPQEDRVYFTDTNDLLMFKLRWIG